VAHDYFKEGEGKEALYKISKAYSVYDGEIGYCQGLSFIIAVLLLEVCMNKLSYINNYVDV